MARLPSFPTEPVHLLAEGIADRKGMTRSLVFSLRLGFSRRLYRAVWRVRVDYWTADELACRMGVHPTALWPGFDRIELDDPTGGGEEVAA